MTDTDALTEKIAGELCDPARHVARWPLVGIDAYCGQCCALAERVLPIIAAEVRKAKAEALREMQEHHEREADKAQTITARGIHLAIADGARTRATEYETRRSDEH